MLKYKYLILFLCCCICTSELFSQTKVYGFVKDRQTGEPMEDVSVYVASTSTGTMTNEKGYYEMLLPSGKVQIRISYVGYGTLDTLCTLSGRSQNLNFFLLSDTRTLSEVSVTGKRPDHNVSQMEMSVQSLDYVAIKKIPALMGEVDVIKTIQLLPGVQAASEGSSGFSVRGGGTDQNLILLDQAPIYNASHFLGFFSVFNNDVVKDATLYKGDLPANYGGRLSSVLDVRMKEEIPEKLNGQGGIGLVTSRLMLHTPLFKHRTSLMLAGRTTYAGLVIPFLSENLQGSNIYFYDLNGKIIQVLNDRNRLYLSAYHGNDKFYVRNLTGLGYGNTSATLRWNHMFGERLVSDLSLIHSRYRYGIDIEYDPYDFTISAGSEDTRWSYDFLMEWNERHTSRFGVGSGFLSFRQGELDDRGGALSQYIMVDASESVARKGLSHTLYFTHEHKMTHSFSLRYGLRLSCFQNIGAEDLYLFDGQYQVYDTLHYGKSEIFHTEIHPEPRLAAMFRINDSSSLKASYSRTVQYAQVASVATGGLPFDVWFPISPNIKPQKCDQWAIGYFRNFMDNMLETSVEIYYKRLQNVIDFKDNALTYGNLLIDGELRCGKGRSYGIELLLRKNTGHLTGWISYTYAKTLRTIDGINFGKEYCSPYDRPHNFVLVVNYDINRRLSVAVNWIYNTGQPVSFPYGQYTIGGVTYAIYNGSRNESRYPAYHRMDMSLTWKLGSHEWKKWESELNVSVYNVYAHHNTWAVTFSQAEDGIGIKTEKMYLFSTVPSISYNIKF